MIQPISLEPPATDSPAPAAMPGRAGSSLLEYIALLSAVAVLLIALCAAVGWIVGSARILRLFPFTSAVAADTALLLFVSAVGLLGLQLRRSLLPAVSALFILGAVAVRLLVGTDPHIFFSLHRFFPEWTMRTVAIQDAHIMILTPPVVILFLLSGTALLCAALERLSVVSLWGLAILGPALLSTGLLAILAMAGRLHTYSGRERFLVQMSPWTALGGICLGISWCAFFAVRHPTARQHRTITLALLSSLTLFFLRSGMDYAIWINGENTQVSQQALEEPQARTRIINTLVAAVRMAESDQRSFLLTQNPQYLESYNNETQNVIAGLEASRRTSIAPSDFDSLAVPIHAKLDRLSAGSTLEQSGQHARAVDLVRSPVGRALNTQIQQQALRLTRLSEQDRDRQARAVGNSLTTVQRAVLLSILVSLLLIAAAVSLVVAEFNRWALEQRRLVDNETLLEERVQQRTRELVHESHERQKTDAAFRQSQESFQTSLAFANVAAWTFDPSLDVIAWAGPIDQVFGLACGQLASYDRFIDRVHPDDRTRVSTAVGETVRYGTDYAAEYRILLPDQTTRWIAGRGGALFRNGIIIQMFGVVYDITEQKNAEFALQSKEQALRERDDKLALVFETGAIGDWNWQLSNGLVTAHPVVFKLFGSSLPHAAEHHSWFRARLHPSDFAVMSARFRAVLRGLAAFELEFRVLWPDGSEHWLACRGAAALNSSGKPAELHGLCIDITQNKALELQLRNSEAQFRHLANAMPQMVWQARPDGHIVFFNSRWYQITGLPADSDGNEGWSTVLHPDDVASFRDRWSGCVQSGDDFEMELRFRETFGNGHRWYLARALAVRDDSARIVRWFGTVTDIHEQKSAEESLESQVVSRTEDLRRALGEKDVLFREVHHRVKNNLQVISSLFNMQSRLLADGAAKAALKEGRQRVLSMALIHERLYSGSQLDQLDFAAYAHSLANDLVSAYARSETIRIHLERHDKVLLNLDQAIPCGLILNELVTNALKYAYPASRGSIVLELSETTDHRITLAVGDSGVGLPPDFDPARSKSLGVQIVQILTQQLNGSLQIRHSPGARFAISFPRA